MRNKTRIFIGLGAFTGAIMLLVFLVGNQPVPAQRVNLCIVSGANTQWSSDRTNWQSAVACWVHPSWPSIKGATWIWRTYQTDVAWEYANVPNEGWNFRRTFNLPDGAYNIFGSVQITADNAYFLYINGRPIGGHDILSQDGPDAQQWKNVETFKIIKSFQPGVNTILIKALNHFSWGSSTSNPAGLIFKAIITYDEPA